MAAQSRRACPDIHHSWAPAGSPIEPDCGPARRNLSRRRRTFIQVYHHRLQSNDFGVSARRSPGLFGAISRRVRDTQSCSKSPWIWTVDSIGRRLFISENDEGYNFELGPNFSDPRTPPYTGSGEHFFCSRVFYTPLRDFSAIDLQARGQKVMPQN